MPKETSQTSDQISPSSPDLSATPAPLSRQLSNGSKTQFKTLQQSQAALARQQLQQQPQQAGPSSIPLSRVVSSSSIDFPQPYKSRKPSLGTSKSTSSRRFKYSTDDDEAEIEEDHEREYYEGYSHGLKHGRRRHATKDKKPHRASSYKDLPALRNKQDDQNQHHHDTKGKKRKASNPYLHSHSSITEIIHEISECEEHHDSRDLSELQTELIDEIEDLDETSSIIAKPIEEDEDEADEYDAYDEDEQDENNNDEEDNASVTSNETFTLRERQDAINITHPFGIRIWKPALYKKDRSVQRIAEGDIHSRPGKDVGWPVWIGNFLCEPPNTAEHPDGKPLKRTNSRKLQQMPVEPIPIQDPNLAVAAAVPAAVGGHHEGGQHEGGHDAPNWSRTKSTVILLSATVLYAIIAEILVDNVDVVLEGANISAKFLGITVFALVPNTTEFLNAISFAMNGNVSLSMEIGSAYALQVCLLQIPALVLYSQWIFETPKDPIMSGNGGAGLMSMFGTFIANGQRNIHDFMFTLIFPRWDLFMVIFCVFLFSYIYAEGKSNYFKGSILVLSYLVVMMGFYFSDKSGAGLDDLSSVVTSVAGMSASSGMIFNHQQN